MQISQQLVQNFKTFRKSETSDCLLNWETRHNSEPSNASQNSRQMIDNIYNNLQPFLVSWLRGLTVPKRSIKLLYQERK